MNTTNFGADQSPVLEFSTAELYGLSLISTGGKVRLMSNATLTIDVHKDI